MTGALYQHLRTGLLLQVSIGDLFEVLVERPFTDFFVIRSR